MRIVERYVRSISAQSPAVVVSQQLERLAIHPCDGLKAVYGDLDRSTYLWNIFRWGFINFIPKLGVFIFQ